MPYILCNVFSLFSYTVSCKRDGAKMQSFSKLKNIFLGACFTWSSNWHLIMLRLIRVRNENMSFEQAAVLEMGVIAHRHSTKLIYPQSALARWVPSTFILQAFKVD